jgi:hypothetical protein
MNLYSVTLDSDDGGWNGYTIVMVFQPAALTLPGDSIIGVRVVFEAAAAENLTITNAYVGHGAAAGDVFDFAATPSQLLFATAGSKAIAAGQTATSDTLAFVYNKTSNFLISFYVGGGVTEDAVRKKTGLSNIDAYSKVANEAATVDKAGYGAAGGGGWNTGIKQIEVDTAFASYAVIF